MIVLAEEHHRGLEHRGEVPRFVDVALGRGAVAEVHDGALVGAVHLPAHGPAHRVQGLRPDRHADVPEPVLPCVVRPAVPRSPVEPQVVHEVDAAHERHGHLPIGREHEVLALQRERAADLRCLLPDERRVHGELALALQRRGLEVGAARHDHQPQDLPEVLVLQPEVARIRVRRPVGCDELSKLAQRCPGTRMRRSLLTRSMRSSANRSAALDVEMPSSFAIWKIALRLRYTVSTWRMARSRS